MKNTSLCYIEQNDSYLMLHRIKKKNDENLHKWIGIGGKLEEGETPYECARREIEEESGLIAKKLFYRGIITFVSNIYGTEYMHLFTCKDFSGILKKDSDEGAIEWVKKSEIEDCKQINKDDNYIEKIHNCLGEKKITNEVALGYKYYIPKVRSFS